MTDEEMAKQLAEKVMGWKEDVDYEVFPNGMINTCLDITDHVSYPFRSMDDALMLIDRMEDYLEGFEEFELGKIKYDLWECNIMDMSVAFEKVPAKAISRAIAKAYRIV